MRVGILRCWGDRRKEVFWESAANVAGGVKGEEEQNLMVRTQVGEQGG